MWRLAAALYLALLLAISTALAVGSLWGALRGRWRERRATRGLERLAGLRSVKAVRAAEALPPAPAPARVHVPSPIGWYVDGVDDADIAHRALMEVLR